MEVKTKIIDKKDWFEQELKKLDHNVESLTYKYILEFSENILGILEKKGIKNKNKFLAKKLNCTPAYISKLFNGKSNFTVKKLIELSAAVNYDLNISLSPKLTVVQASSASPTIINVNGQLVNISRIGEHQTIQVNNYSEVLITEQDIEAA